MASVVKSVFFFLIIITSLSAYKARRLIRSDDSGSGDKTWEVVHFFKDAQVDDDPNSSTALEFKVGDVIRVKFERDPVAVLVVTKAEYESCKSDQPIRVLNTMDAAFKLDHPGMFYCVSGMFKDCIRGQKQMIQVSP